MNDTPAISPAEHAGASELDQLELHVQSHLSGRIRRLRLFAQPGGIVLRGWTRTYHAKQLAQHTLMRLTQVPILANEIEVC